MRKKYLYFLAAAHLSVDINTGALPAILPFLVSYYGMDFTAMTGLMFASSFLSSFIQPVFGWLADRSSRLWFMGLGVLLAGLSLGMTGFLTQYWAIFISITLMGIGNAIFHPEAARLVNAISGKKQGAGMSIFSVGGNAGFGLGPLLAVAVLSNFGMKGMAAFSGISLIMGTTLLLFAPCIKHSVETTQNGQILDEVASKKDVVESVGCNDWSSFKRLTTVIIFRSIVFCGISSFLPLFCIQVMGVSNEVGSMTLSVLSMVGIMTTLVGGWFVDRWGCVKVLQRGCSLLVPILAIMIFVPKIDVIYALLVPLSLAMHGTYSSFVVLGQNYLAKSIGFASGVTFGLSFSVGGIVLPLLGWFADLNGIEAVMTLLVILAVICALATLLLPEPKERWVVKEVNIK